VLDGTEQKGLGGDGIVSAIGLMKLKGDGEGKERGLSMLVDLFGEDGSSKRSPRARLYSSIPTEITLPDTSERAWRVM